MTNKELATAIQSGNRSLIPTLWENVQKLLYAMSDSFYRLHRELCARRGVDVQDIRQTAYSALLEAIKAYKPESESKFTSYLNYPFKNAVNGLLGLRTTRANNEPLNSSTSLDRPIDESSDGDSEKRVNVYIKQKLEQVFSLLLSIQRKSGQPKPTV